MASFSKENCLLFWNIITIPPVCKNVWRTRNYKGPNRKDPFFLGEHFFTQAIPQAPPWAIPHLHKYLLRQRDEGLHQPAQQCEALWGKDASEKKAQHGKKKPSFLWCSYLDARSLSQKKSWGWKEELQTIPKAAYDWKFQIRKTFFKLITSGLAINPSF